MWRTMEKLYREEKDYQFALQRHRDEEDAVLQQIGSLLLKQLILRIIIK
jgi:hypothetical protein